MNRFVSVFVVSVCASFANADDVVLNPSRHVSNGTRLGTAISADGKTFVTVDDARSLRVWDATNGKLTRELWLPEHAGSGVSPKVWLAPNAKFVVVPYRSRLEPYGKLAILPLDDSGTYRVIGGNIFEVTHLAFSPDSTRIATTCQRGPIFVWDAETGKKLDEIEHDADLRCMWLCFTPDGKQLSAGLPMFNFHEKKQSIIGTYDFATKRFVSEIPYKRDGTPRPEWSPNGQLLAVHYNTELIDIFDADGKLKHTIGKPPLEMPLAGMFDSANRFVTVWQRKDDLVVRDELGGCDLGKTSLPDLPRGGRVFLADDCKRALVETDTQHFAWRMVQFKKDISGGEVTRFPVGGTLSYTAIAWNDTESIAWTTEPLTPKKPPRFVNAFDCGKAELNVRGLQKAKGATTEWSGTTLKQDSYRATTTIKDKTVTLNYIVEEDYDSIYAGTLASEKHAILTTAGGTFGFDTATGERAIQYKPRHYAMHIAPSANGKFFATANAVSPVISIFRVGQPEPVLFVFTHYSEWIAWTPDGAWSSSQGGTKLAGTLSQPAEGKLPVFMPFPTEKRNADKVKYAVK
jgi:WD40 repeat protein